MRRIFGIIMDYNRTSASLSLASRFRYEVICSQVCRGKVHRGQSYKAIAFDLKQALRALGLREVGRLPQGAPEKAVLACWLRRRTTVSLRWASERLGMGHYTRVTQVVTRAGRRPGLKLSRIKRKLARLETLSRA
jgi:hypothetical protein